MFDKEEYKREIFRKYEEKLNSKKTLRKRTKRILVTAVSCVSIILLTTTVIYTKNKLYEKDINEKTHTLNPGKIYDGDQTANIVENKIVNNNSSVNNKEENIINEVENNDSQNNYEPTSELCRLLKIVKLDPKNYRINKENYEEFETDEYYYEGVSWDAESTFTKDYYIIGMQDNNLVVTIKGSEEMKNVIQNSSLKGNIQVEYNKNYLINNVSAEDIDTIFYAGYGQDIFEPFIVYLIQKDGTVKGLDIIDGCKNGTFVADIVPGLENIERIENMDSREIEGGGARTVIAFAKDGTIYELDYSEYNKLLSERRHY